MRLWFYEPTSTNEPHINRLVAKADGPFCHCELQFNDGAAFTLYMGSPAIMRRRTFKSKNYSCVSVKCSIEQESACRACAEEACRVGVPFSIVRMMNAYWQTSIISTPLHTLQSAQLQTHGVPLLLAVGSFCSELVVMALQAGHVIPITTSAAYTSPSALARLLSSNVSSIGVSVRTAAASLRGSGTTSACSQAIDFRAVR